MTPPFRDQVPLQSDSIGTPETIDLLVTHNNEVISKQTNTTSMVTNSASVHPVSKAVESQSGMDGLTKVSGSDQALLLGYILNYQT